MTVAAAFLARRLARARSGCNSSVRVFASTAMGSEAGSTEATVSFSASCSAGPPSVATIGAVDLRLRAARGTNTCKWLPFGANAWPSMTVAGMVPTAVVPSVNPGTGQEAISAIETETEASVETIQCDSVRRKRKKKMNKHKHSKRRRLNKHKR